MGRDVIKCQNCGKSITPEEVEAGISVVCPSCADNKDDEACCSDTKPESKIKSGCGCC